LRLFHDFPFVEWMLGESAGKVGALRVLLVGRIRDFWGVREIIKKQLLVHSRFATFQNMENARLCYIAHKRNIAERAAVIRAALRQAARQNVQKRHIVSMRHYLPKKRKRHIFFS